MAFTVQNAADDARLTLNDAQKVRYPDTELLTYANMAYQLLRRFRPDFFVGNYSNGALPTLLGLTDTFPVDDMYRPAIADFLIARAESKDDEHIVQQRAQAFFQLFGLETFGVNGLAMTPPTPAGA